MTDFGWSALPREVGFGTKSRASNGRVRKDRGLVEVSVHMTQEDFAVLKCRASWQDKSLSAQVRSDVQDANRRYIGSSAARE